MGYKVKIMKNYRYILVGIGMFIIIMSSFQAGMGAEIDPKKIKTSWREGTLEQSLFREWNEESIIINYSGTIDRDYVLHSHSFNESENTWTKERRENHYISNYSYFSETKMKGNISSHMILQGYQVEVALDKKVSLQWFALRQGSIDFESFQESYSKQYNYQEQYVQEVTSHFEKFDLSTGQSLAQWVSYEEIPDSINVSLEETTSDSTTYSQHQMTFTMPIMLTMQVFENSEGAKIAWAEMFNEFLVYRDLDEDLIYSAGESEDLQGNGFSLYSSDEFCGVYRPMALEQHSYQEINYIDHPQDSYNQTIHVNYPQDISVNEIANQITFTPPETVDNTISWDILYPQMSTYAVITDPEKPPEEWYSSTFNSTMENATPGNFSYGFDYSIGSQQATLNFTLGLSAIEEPALKEALKDLGITLPFHDYFLATTDIEEVDQVDLSMPADMFSFESNGQTVAEINLINPLKKNYTLEDYPKVGINTELESLGGSLHHIIVSDQEQNSNIGNPILNLIYTLRDFVEQDTSFTIVDSLYHVHTLNYPTWAGKKLTHDPTLIVYFAPSAPPPSIPGMPIMWEIGVVSISISTIILIKIKKNRKIQSKEKIQKPILIHFLFK